MTVKRKGGRPRRYCDTYPARAREHVGMGGSLRGFAAKVGVSPASICNWLNNHPEFDDAVRAGRREWICRESGTEDPPLLPEGQDAIEHAQSPASADSYDAPPPPHRPAAVFAPLCTPARYKGAWGGRGSGKSHFFAELLLRDCIAQRGLRGVCIREIQKSLKYSAKSLIEAKLEQLRLRGFRVFSERIETPGDGIILFQGMQDHTAESIKSLEGFGRAWVEEAQCLSARSLELLRPTIRAPGSQLWFSWNPRLKTDPVDRLLRGAELPSGAAVVRTNWRDNDWFTAELEQERLDCLRLSPDQYDHIWEGDYVTVSEGAYYAKCLAEARAAGRIGHVAFDPLMQVRLFLDIGGAGARADACAIWPAQFVGREIRVRDYYEAQGQPLAAHVAWLRANGYGPDRAAIWLPHDGATTDRVFAVSYESALRDAGYAVTVVPNQGRGAAAARIEAARRLFPSIWFDEATTEAGRLALGWYHEKKDEARGIGLGPRHDWSSHGADAFGLMCVAYEAPGEPVAVRRRTRPRRNYGDDGWMY